MSCLQIGTKLFYMKNAFLLLLTSLFLYSCKCEREEVGRNLLIADNKEYLNTNKRTLEYYNQDNDIVKANFDGAKSVISEDKEGPEVCSYITNEKATESFVFGSYSGTALFNNNLLYIELYNGVERNVFNLLDIPNAKYDNALQNVTLNEFSFNNILLLEKVSEGGSINKIVYSKTNGIEFILFENGTWYKLLE